MEMAKAPDQRHPNDCNILNLMNSNRSHRSHRNALSNAPIL